MSLIQVPEITLRVMSLNMQYAAGQEVGEKNFLKHIPLKEQEHNLDAIVNVIEEANPDIVLLQEADHGSSRTDFVNQPEYIVKQLAQKHQSLQYHPPEVSSDLKFDERKSMRFYKAARYFYHGKRAKFLFDKLGIQTDMLPPEPVVLDFGKAILSKYPLREKKHDFFIPPYWNPWMNFNIIRQKDERKSLLVCRVNYHQEIEEKVPLFVYNIHLENKNSENRKSQSKILYRRLDEHFEEHQDEEADEQKRRQSEFVYNKLSKRKDVHKILAGDFNAEPLEAEYDLESGTKDESLERLLRHPQMQFFPGIYPQQNKKPAPHFATYPSNQPSQILDTILISKYLEFTNYRVDRIRVSDHLAVIADIKINADLVQENLLKEIVNPFVEPTEDQEEP